MVNINKGDIEFNKKRKRTEDVLSEENILFTQLNLKDNVLKGLLFNGFNYPSPIQVKAIPMGLLGLDLIIQAKSGTGKTCVFSVIALECIHIPSKVAQVLIVSPTREIAFQSLNVIQSIGCFLENLNCQLFIGGIKVHEDLKKIKHCHIIVGTPGRIKYLIEENHIQTDSIRLLILDEADMLFTDNFQNTMNYIYNALPMNKQMLTLSATYTDVMIDTIITYMNSPVMIRLNKNEKATLLGIKHYYKLICEDLSPREIFFSKTEVLLEILSSVDFQQCIVFSNYQSIAQDLCDILDSKGWSSAYISGSLDQKQRIGIYNKLKSFHCRVLITTDLTSRGIDAENVNLVINLGLPWDFETYLHRMGRAGRYGSHGAVISIVTKEEWHLLNDIKEKCCIDLYQLPSEIPCDLLENLINAQVDNVIVKKLNKADKSNILHEGFKIYNKYKENDYIKFKSISEIVENFSTKNHKQNDFYDIFKSFKSRTVDYDISQLPEITGSFNSDLYKLIENRIYQTANVDIDNQKSKDEIIKNTDNNNIRISNEDILELENEFDRLSKWAMFYSQQFQICNDQITTKTEQLNKHFL